MEIVADHESLFFIEDIFSWCSYSRNVGALRRFLSLRPSRNPLEDKLPKLVAYHNGNDCERRSGKAA